MARCEGAPHWNVPRDDAVSRGKADQDDEDEGEKMAGLHRPIPHGLRYNNCIKNNTSQDSVPKNPSPHEEAHASPAGDSDSRRNEHRAEERKLLGVRKPAEDGEQRR